MKPTSRAPRRRREVRGSALNDAMSKNIVICADGTGQRGDGRRPSNVARLCSILELDDRQICAYDPGVGTVFHEGFDSLLDGSLVDFLGERPSSRTRWSPVTWFTKVAGGAVGYGLRPNVEELFCYLADRYEDGDRIYLFGFSRGAFTVRALAGLIHRCGLLKRTDLEFSGKAFKLYRPHCESMSNDRRAELLARVKRFREAHARPGKIVIHFLGIWDTVKSYGYIRPISLPHTRHNPEVTTVRHAVSLHERRSPFALTTWGWRDDDVKNGVAPANSRPGDVMEVWFAGDHSDVGGGHTDGRVGLAAFPLKWVIDEACKVGLRVAPARYKDALDRLERPRCVHDLASRVTWRALEWLPRREIHHAARPPETRTVWGPGGPRDVCESLRKGEVLIHESAYASQRLCDGGELESWKERCPHTVVIDSPSTGHR